MQFVDSFRHKGLRLRLVEVLKTQGFYNKRLLEAFSNVPRHIFMDSSFLKFAYKDSAFPIGSGQTISQPSTVASQTTLLMIEDNIKVLEIGTGSGYQSAILGEMGVELYTIERQGKLFKKSQKVLTALGYNRIKCFLGDGNKGLPDYAPFDRVLVTAGCRDVPESLLLQLKIGGYMVLPVGSPKQVMTRIKRVGEHDFEKEEYGDCAFVPMLNGISDIK
ncbi:protein-L-isoaspartate(D-aspartate) O-methyltransferase [Marinilabiliaceae bacterium ANBcel2]|nr:protein-L-isoaspartate(D-aspartate) O-methyltransferase [Marinilabiliaceae bacterium ANBcel2]